MTKVCFYYIEKENCIKCDKTVIKCSEIGLMIRLIIVLQQRKNYSCDSYENDSIIVDAMLTQENLQDLINEEFNPDVIQLEKLNK